jgi:hypothetical protein
MYEVMDANHLLSILYKWSKYQNAPIICEPITNSGSRTINLYKYIQNLDPEKKD